MLNVVACAREASRNCLLYRVQMQEGQSKFISMHTQIAVPD